MLEFRACHKRKIGWSRRCAAFLLLLYLLLPHCSGSGLAARHGSSFFYASYRNNRLVSHDAGLVFRLNASHFVFGVLLTLSVAMESDANMPGIPRLEALRFAVKKFNERAPAPRITYGYHVIDTQGDVSHAVSGGLQFLREDIISVIGPTTSNEALSTIFLLANYNVSMTSYSATSISLKRNSYGTFLRTIPSDASQMRAIFSVLLSFNWSLVVPVFTSDAYGLSGHMYFEREAGRHQILTDCFTILPYYDSSLKEPHAMLNQTIAQLARCIAQSDANVILLYMNFDNAANVLAELAKDQANQHLTFIGPDSWLIFVDSPQIYVRDRFPLSFLKGKGSFPLMAIDLSGCVGTIGVSPTIGDVAEFQEHFSSLSPANNNYSLFLNYWERSFLCRLPKHDAHSSALPVCPESVDSRAYPISCRCTGNENLSSVPIDAKIGYVMDAVGINVAGLERILYNCSQLNNAQLCEKTRITGKDLLYAVNGLNYSGVTGNFYFKNMNRKSKRPFAIEARAADDLYACLLRVDGILDVFQLDAHCRRTIVGHYSRREIMLNASKLTFKTPGIPISAVIPDEHTYTTTAVGGIFFALASILIVTSALIMVYLYQNRTNRVIHKSSPTFCQLILVGIISASAGVLVSTLPASTLICILSYWFVVLGFALIMANLLAKTYRIFKIFRNIRVASASITDMVLFRYSGCVILVEVIMLLVLTFADGTLRCVIHYSTLDPLYSYPLCKTNHVHFQNAMLIVISVTNFALVFLIAVLAFLTRHVSNECNESRYIALTVYTYCLLTLILVPIYTTTSDGYHCGLWISLQRMTDVVVAVIVTLCALFGPKLIAIRHSKREAFEARLALSDNSRIITHSRLIEPSNPRFLSSFLWSSTPSERHSLLTSTRANN